MRRIMGMVSFYSSARKELVPDIKSSEIINMPMSDYQFDKYSIIRKDEIDRDKRKKKPTNVKDEDAFSVNSFVVPIPVCCVNLYSQKIYLDHLKEMQKI